MPERTAPDAALRFVRDLKSLREGRGVSLDSLHEATRVPMDVLDTFESTALYGNRLFNRVYLRSLVRAYTGTIGYDADQALLALEEALAGQYDGSLLREPESLQEHEVIIEEGGEPVAETAFSAADVEIEEAPEAAEVRPEDQEIHATSPASFETPDRPISLRAIPSAEPPPAVAWDAVSGSARHPRVRGAETPWAAILGGIGVLALIVFGVIWWLSRSPDEPLDEVAVATPTDTAKQQVPALHPVTLPDTLVLRVTATNGPVSDIKIQRDGDVRRPYWIEVGQSQDFPFLNRVTVENELADATITVQGVAYPTSRTDEQGRLVIVRDTVLRLLQQR